ncbi:MAG: hypothetical protein Q9204_004885, partial [Flavoplaca sp. TL-2023a]
PNVIHFAGEASSLTANAGSEVQEKMAWESTQGMTDHGQKLHAIKQEAVHLNPRK